MRSIVLSLFLVGCGLDGPDEDVAIGELACGSGQWCIETTPTTLLLHGVWAASATDVFAVGDGGTILRRVAGVWTPMASGSLANLRGVWGTSGSDVWAVGQGGAVLHFDGVAWTPRTVTTSDIDAVWQSSASDIWMSGASTVWHSTGGAFTATGMVGELIGLSGTGPNDVWVAGENSYLHHWTTKWTLVNPGAGTSTYFSIIARATNDVWTSDYSPGKETAHFNGSKWTTVRTGGAVFEGMFPMSASDIWGVGAMKIGRWNGSAWTVTTLTGVTTSLWSVTGAPGNVWSVGDNGVIAYYMY